MVVELTNGGGAEGWFDAKEMCEEGCQSLVAILSAKGRPKSVLIGAITSRPEGTGRAPD